MACANSNTFLSAFLNPIWAWPTGGCSSKKMPKRMHTQTTWLISQKMVENQMTEARKIYDIKMQVQQCCSVDPAMCENVTNLNIKRMNPTSIIVNSLFHTYDYLKILWYEYFRSPSSMAISWSYVSLCTKSNKKVHWQKLCQIVKIKYLYPWNNMGWLNFKIGRF